MPSDRPGRAPLPIGPSGNLLTLEDLPPSDTVRWVIRRKTELVAAIRGGLLSLEDARAAGRDYLTQTEEAVRAGHEARPDLTASEILAQVRRLQQS